MLPLVTTMPTALAAISIGGAQCGTRICALYQFCSRIHSECEECAPKCDESGHNFDQELCMSECQSERLF